MKSLSFFGHKTAFDYHNIGGTDSIVRRLSNVLARQGKADVSLVTYGHSSSSPPERHERALVSIRRRTLDEALTSLATRDHVISVYLPPLDRLRFSFLRKATAPGTTYHSLFCSWPASRFKRSLMLAEARLQPFNGHCFGVSPRLAAKLQALTPRSALLYPPVDERYFRPPEALPGASSPPLRVSYVGRLDEGKGIAAVLELFSKLSSREDVELLLCGIRWPGDRKAKALHDRLARQREFRYISHDFSSHSDTIDSKVARLLRQTDILVLPYKHTHSTIDAPLLILEAIAAVTPVLTRRLGAISTIYGEGAFYLPRRRTVEAAMARILDAAAWLPAERARLLEQRSHLSFDSASVAALLAAKLSL